MSQIDLVGSISVIFKIITIVACHALPIQNIDVVDVS